MCRCLSKDLCRWFLAGHKQTPSTHLPNTNTVKDSGRVRCRHLCQACCPLKDRFGTVPKSSITHAFISMIHPWAKSTDGNGSTTRVVLFDFRKAFDLIDHHVLARKLSSYDIPRSISCWIIDFLMDREQRIKLSRDCFSEWEAVPAGVPRGRNWAPGCSLS